MYDPTKAASLLPLLPLPLAQALRRALNAKSPEGAHLGAYYFFEASLKLTAASLVAVYLQDGAKEPKLNKVIENLARPSTGHWLNLLREISNWLGGRPDAGLLPLSGVGKRLTERAPRPACTAFIRFAAKAQDKEDNRSNVSVLDLFDAIVGYRNAEVGHGGQRTQAFYSEASPLLVAAMLEGFEALNPFEGLMFCVARDVIDTRSSRTVRRYEVLRGDGIHVPFDDENREADTHIPAGQLLLVGRNVRVRLHPLLVYELDELERDRVGFLNKVGVRRGKTEQVGVKNVEYLDYDSGARLTSHNPTEELAALLTRVSGQQVSAGDIDNAGEAPDSEAGLGQAVPGGAAAEWIGDFEILGELGRGGMGIVYKARQGSLKRVVALKVLPPGVSGDPIAVARFKREISALARCDHANVIKVLAAGQDGDRYYYAMEYVEGSDLAGVYGVLTQHRDKSGEFRDRDLLKAISSAGQSRAEKHPADMGLNVPKLSKGTAVISRDKGKDYYVRLAEIVGQAAAGVAHLHSHGIIHRDLKPGNIMLTTDGSRAIIMDLGLAQMQDQSVALTMSSVKVLGTLRYMPPEQLQHQMLEIKETADIYSLGATLYELAALAPMFDGDSEARLMQQVLQEEPKNVRQINRAVPKDLETVIKVATSKLPGERYPTAVAMQRDLEAFARGEPIVARAPGTFHYLRLFYRKNKSLVATIVVAMAMMVALVSWFVINLNASRAEAVAQKETAEQQRQEADKQREFAEQQRQEADKQREIAEVQKREAERQSRIATEQRNEAERQTEIANQQRTEAVRQTEIANSARKAAEESEGRAITEAERARKAERESQVRLAESLMSSGESLASAEAWEQAREKYKAARKALQDVGMSTFAVEACLSTTYGNAPPAVMEYGGGDFGDLSHMALHSDGRTVALAGEAGAALFDFEDWRRVRVLEGHRGPVLAVAFSPDGKRLASAGADASVRIWQVETGQLLHTMWGHTDRVVALAFTKDFVISAARDNTVRGWNPETGLEQYRTELPASAAAMVLSPDGTVLVVADGKRGLHVLTPAGEVTRSFEFDGVNFPTALAFDPDSKALWCAGSRGLARHFGLTGERLGEFRGEERRIVSLAVSADGEVLVAGSVDHPTTLYQTADGAVIRKINGHFSTTAAVAFHADGKRLLSCGDDSQLRLWWLEDGTELRRFHTDDSPTRAMAFSPNGRLLATAPSYGGLRVWDARSGRHFFFHETFPEIKAMVFVPGTALLCMGCVDTNIYRYDFVADEDLPALKGHTGPIASMAVSPDGTLLASGSWDRTVRIWDLKTGECKRVIEAHQIPEGSHAVAVTALIFAPSGKLVASGGGDRMMYIWSLETGKQLFNATHDAPVSGIFFTNEGNCFTSDTEGNVHFWDLHNSQHKTYLLRLTGAAWCLRRSPDDRYFAVGQADGYVRICDTRTGVTKRVWKEETDISALEWHPYHPLLVTANDARRIKLWNTNMDGEVRGLVNPRTDFVMRLQFSEDGELAFGSGGSKGLQVWHLRSAAHLAFMGGHTAATQDLQLFPGATRAITAGREGMLKVWDVEEAKVLHEWRSDHGPTWTCAISPDGGTVAVATSNGKVLLLSPELEVRLGPVTIDSAVRMLRYSPDGTKLLCGLEEGPLVMLNASDLTLAGRFVGGEPGLGLLSAAFSPDGTLVASGHDGGTLQVWDVATLRQLTSVKLHSGDLYGLRFTTDGGYILTAAADNRRRMYDVRRRESVAAWISLPTVMLDAGQVPTDARVVVAADGGSVMVEDFSRPAAYDEFERRLPALFEALPWQEDELDPELAVLLGRWYAHCGIDEWAVVMLEYALNKGQRVDLEEYAALHWREGLRWVSVESLYAALGVYEALEKAESTLSRRLAIKAIKAQIKEWE
ncbi:MAG: protein kinase [Planctomycetes bacterium]|nr:protein kinase [Planctomycetota bacterium]MCW8136574.1 protein kinase [Planctomycetota bacterium]